MNFSKIIAVTGQSGLFELKGTRKDGLVLRSLEDNKTTFVPQRLNSFSALESVAIYTQDGGTVPLRQVMRQISELSLVLPASNASPAELRDFMIMALPDHDREKVYTSDIKKLIKWYNSVQKHQIDLSDPEPEAIDTTEITEEESK
ncbi:MAG: DUF5606 domain-containing protein [Sphingobacteriales bacterium]|nr:DUF5606 domain-containing protein [Sphingobacteriales bacterium]